MQIVRNVLWSLVVLVALFFVFLNWNEDHPVVIWPGDEATRIVFDWPVGFIALVFFLVGMVPTWLLHRGTRWRLTRRIKSLENAARAAAITPSAPSQEAPSASAPQLSSETSSSQDDSAS